MLPKKIKIHTHTVHVYAREKQRIQNWMLDDVVKTNGSTLG